MFEIGARGPFELAWRHHKAAFTWSQATASIAIAVVTQTSQTRHHRPEAATRMGYPTSNVVTTRRTGSPAGRECAVYSNSLISIVTKRISAADQRTRERDRIAIPPASSLETPRRKRPRGRELPESCNGGESPEPRK